jgi:hypothetical protein
VPRWLESDGTDENVKMTAAQTTTGSQRETMSSIFAAITGAR